jgi:hypothetical protein
VAGAAAEASTCVEASSANVEAAVEIKLPLASVCASPGASVVPCCSVGASMEAAAARAPPTEMSEVLVSVTEAAGVTAMPSETSAGAVFSRGESAVSSCIVDRVVVSGGVTNLRFGSIKFESNAEVSDGPWWERPSGGLPVRYVYSRTP